MSPDPEDVAEQLTGRPQLSYSAVRTYVSCPLRWYFRYVLALPEHTVSASLAFGAAVHRAVEGHFRALMRGLPVPTLDELMAMYRESWRARAEQGVRFSRGDDQATLVGLASRMLVAFRASELARPAGRVVGVETELSAAVVPGVPPLLARLDVVVDEGDQLAITDIKTSRARWSDEHVRDSSDQLFLYHELAQPLATGARIRLEFAVLTKTRLPEVNRQERELSLVSRVLILAVRCSKCSHAPQAMTITQHLTRTAMMLAVPPESRRNCLVNVIDRLALGVLVAFVCGIAARAEDSKEKGALVCKTLHAKQFPDQIKTEVKAVTFTAPNGNGRRGAAGLLVPTRGKPGTRIAFKFQRSPSGYGFQVIHPLKDGHVLASVSADAVTLYRGGSWVDIGWGNPATSEKIVTTKKAGEVFPIQPDKEHDVISELSSSARYRLWINGTLVCEHQIKDAKPLVLEMKDEAVWGGSQAATLYGRFDGPSFEPKLESGQAGVIVGPTDGRGNRQRLDEIKIATGV